MKQIIFSLILLGFAIASFCQQSVQKQALTKTDYLLKSKKQKKIGWIFLGGGVAMFAVSAIIPKGELTGEISYPCLCEDVRENDNIKAAFFVAGAASALASIPFFIASGKNKRRAMRASVFINMEKIPVSQNTDIGNRSFPAVGMRIGL